MPIDFSKPELTELTPKIAVIGVGGAGCNAVNNMINASLQGVDFVVANTDAQSLANSLADNRLQLGVETTSGLGAGAQPQVGQAAAEESLEQIEAMLNGCHMAFVTAGMGGGTGTGAAPVIAQTARAKGILTVGVVTKPFQFEGGRRMRIADAGIEALAENVDTLIIIPNQNLFRVANERTTFAEAFTMADEVLHSGVRGVTDLMVMPGLINLDFADVRTVMSEMGKAMMGTGEAEGETRAVDAASAAIANPLLEDASLKGAKGVIINVTGGMDMTLYEVDEAVNMVREQADPDALIVFGSAFDDDLSGKLRVSVVATGIEGGDITRMPAPIRPTRGEDKEEASVTAANASAPISKAPEIATDLMPEDVADTVKSEDDLTLSEIAPAVDSDNSLGERADAESVEPAVTECEEEEASEADVLEEQALAQNNDMFVAEAPAEPKASMAGLKQPNVFEEAAYSSGQTDERVTAEEADSKAEKATGVPQKKGVGKPSLFQLMTSGRKAKTEEAAPVNAEDPEPVRDPGRVTFGANDDVSEGGNAVTEEDKDQLEIPSFLTRTKN